VEKEYGLRAKKNPGQLLGPFPHGGCGGSFMYAIASPSCFHAACPVNAILGLL